MVARPLLSPTSVSGTERERLTSLRALGLLDTPPEERFDRITRLATELFGVPIAYVSFVDENREWLKSSCGCDVEERPREASLCDPTIARHRPLVIPDTLADERFRHHPMVTGEPHLRFYAGYPLAGPGGHLVGTFCIADHRPRRLGPDDYRRLRLLVEMVEHELHLADVIGLQLDLITAQAEAEAMHQVHEETIAALDASRQRLADELAQGSRYVQSLLPRPLLSGPVRTDWVYVPSAELGGDAFGYHWLDDDYFALYLLDVCGHGTGAALHSVSVLNVLRAETLGNVDFRDPGAVLAALNAAFQMKQYHNMYFTIWYGVFDRRSRRLTYATGGHPPALLTHTATPDARVEQLRTRGLLIGGVRDAVYPTASCPLPPGSSLYLFSDGAYEVRRPDGSMMGLDDFVDLLGASVAAGRSAPEDILAHIDAIRHCETCADDLALLRITFA